MFQNQRMPEQNESEPHLTCQYIPVYPYLKLA